MAKTYYKHMSGKMYIPYSLCLLLFQVNKVVQMYETMMTRHTTMVVGPTGGGKSVVISTLCQAQTKSVSVYITTFRFFCVGNCNLYLSDHQIGIANQDVSPEP